MVSLTDVLSVIVFTGIEMMNVAFAPESKVEPVIELLSKMTVDDSGSSGSERNSGATGHLSEPSNLGVAPSGVAAKSLVFMSATSPFGGTQYIFNSTFRLPLETLMLASFTHVG